jgi:flagellar biosynthesis GTPase FlhF
MLRYKIVPNDTDYPEFHVQIKLSFEDYFEDGANRKEIIAYIYNRYTFYDLYKKKDGAPKNHNRQKSRDWKEVYEIASMKAAIAKIKKAFSKRFFVLKRKHIGGKATKSSCMAIPKAAGDYEFEEQIILSSADYRKASADDKVGIVNCIFGRYTFMDRESDEIIPMLKAKNKIVNALNYQIRQLEQKKRRIDEVDDDNEEGDNEKEDDEEEEKEEDDDEEGEVLKQAVTAPKRSKPNAVHVPIKQEDTAVEVIEIDDDSDIGTVGLAASSSRVSNIENQALAEAKAAVDVAVAKLKFEEAKIAEQNILNRRNA